MTIEKLNTQQLFACLDQAASQFVQLAASFEATKINITPFKNSWTAAQVAEHIAKSNYSVTTPFLASGKPANREPDKRVPELKNLFLDFNTKLNSPQIVLPLQQSYEKETLVAKLTKSFEDLKEARNAVNLFEVIDIGPLGEMTKLETLYFLLYHTQRHTHQLQNIYRITKLLK